MCRECALAAEADFILSGDNRHPLALQAFRGIPIVRPAELLQRLAAGKRRFFYSDASVQEPEQGSDAKEPHFTKKACRVDKSAHRRKV